MEQLYISTPYSLNNTFLEINMKIHNIHKPPIGLFNNKEINNMRHIRLCIEISMLKN